MLNQNCRFPILFIFFGILIINSTSTTQAQYFWLNQPKDHAISIEALKPSLNYPFYRVNFSTVSSAWFLTGQYHHNDYLFFIELPVAHAKSERPEFNRDFDSETFVGNPLIGLHYFWDRHRIELAVRLPLAPDDKDFALFYGRFSDPDRVEAFAFDILTISGKMHGQFNSRRGFQYHWQAGPSILIDTEVLDLFDSDILIDYALKAGIGDQDYSIFGGISGRVLTTDSVNEFPDRFMHHALIHASYQFMAFRPGFHFRVPIQNEEIKEILDFVFGINLIYRL